MAQNLVVNFIGNNKLSKTTAVLVSDFKKLDSVVKTVGGKLDKTLAGVGLGLGVAKVAGFLKDSAKAASDDYKAKNLLALSLENVVGASKNAIAGVESWIESTSNSTAVLDDDLRPALQKLVTATGDVGKAQSLLSLALDVSAYTGKDLQTVSASLSKAYNGNTTSLKKLVPGLKDTSNWFAELEDKTKGAAETAANSDPFKKMSNIFQNLQETIGYALLPSLQQFTDYLTSPEGQQQIQKIADVFIGIAHAVGTVISLVTHNITLFGVLAITVLTVKAAITGITVAMKIYEMATKIAKIETMALKVAIASTGIGLLVVAVSTLAGLWMEATANVNEYGDAVDNATNPNETTFYNGSYLLPGQAPANGWENFTPLVDAINDPRLTEAMKNAIKSHLHEVINIDYLKGRIYADGKLIWTSWGEASAAAIKASGEEIQKALNEQIRYVKTTAEKFRDTVGLAFGTFGKDENSVFNVDVIIGKMKRMVAAAAGFAENIKALRGKGVTQSVIDQLIAMGPAQGNIVAKGLLASGSKLSTFLGLQESLYGTGASVAAQQAITPNATYEININKAVISASDIIREIRTYEKKTGRKYLVN